jgi:hypothetical protein
MEHFSSEDQNLALVVLEHDQLAGAKSRQYPRRKLGPWESFVVWSLRIYVLFMLAVVIYQILNASS